MPAVWPLRLMSAEKGAILPPGLGLGLGGGVVAGRDMIGLPYGPFFVL